MQFQWQRFRIAYHLPQNTSFCLQTQICHSISWKKKKNLTLQSPWPFPYPHIPQTAYTIILQSLGSRHNWTSDL